MLRCSALVCGGLVLGLAFAPAAAAQDRPAVVIRDGAARTYRVALQRFSEGSGSGERSGRLREAIGAGLEFSGLFDVISPQAFLAADATVSLDGGPGVVCSDWGQIGADAMVEGEVRSDATGISAEFRAWDVARCQKLVRKRYRGASADLPRVGKRIADEIVGAFTGRPGVSSTEIAFVSTRSGAREIFVMDADGGSVRPATSNRSINTFPDWGPDGNTIVYTSYREHKRPGLFVLTRGGQSPGRILRSIDSRSPVYRGVFDPSGQRLALVMSMDGASEILTVERGGRNLKRLTRNRAIDVSPTWSPDGRWIAFVSDRAGGPQVYVMDSDGGNVRRVTFQGDYNTGAAWSPDGRWIAYESRVGGQFDIWLTDPEGTVNVPVVTHPRNDEHPTWAPDGRKIAFQSTRRGRADIYVSDLDGENVRQVTHDAGNNTSPSWGPYLK